MHEKLEFGLKKVKRGIFHLVKIAPKGVFEKNEKVLKNPLSLQFSLKISTLS